MRSSLLSAVRNMTSSRQSPKRSADSAGVALVPLFDAQPAAVNSVVSVSFSQSHFVMLVRSSSSRRASPSHQMAKLHERGLRFDTTSPLTSQTPPRPGPDA